MALPIQTSSVSARVSAASNNGMEVLLTVAEAAAYLRVSRATLWRWCQEGRVPALKIGHEWRVVNPALQRLVEAAIPAEGPRDGSSPSSSAESSSASS
jgi:excisionase family DNA binding protein